MSAPVVPLPTSGPMCRGCGHHYDHHPQPFGQYKAFCTWRGCGCPQLLRHQPLNLHPEAAS